MVIVRFAKWVSPSGKISTNLLDDKNTLTKYDTPRALISSRLLEFDLLALGGS